MAAWEKWQQSYLRKINDDKIIEKNECLLRLKDLKERIDRLAGLTDGELKVLSDFLAEITTKGFALSPQPKTNPPSAFAPDQKLNINPKK